MFRTLLILAITTLVVARPAAAAGPPIDTMSFDETIALDPLGDAAITLTFTLSAPQYQNWQQKYGQNKALLKRDLSRVVSQYETYNWDAQTNEMERRITVSVSAHGAVVHRGGGQYELDVPKNWRGGQVNGTTLEYNYVESLGVGLVGQYNVKVVLPSDARDIAKTTGESGEPVVRYTVPVTRRAGTLVLLISGVMTLVLGAVLMSVAVLVHRRRPGGTVGNLPMTAGRVGMLALVALAALRGVAGAGPATPGELLAKLGTAIDGGDAAGVRASFDTSKPGGRDYPEFLVAIAAMNAGKVAVLAKADGYGAAVRARAEPLLVRAWGAATLAYGPQLAGATDLTEGSRFYPPGFKGEAVIVKKGGAFLLDASKVLDGVDAAYLKTEKARFVKLGADWTKAARSTTSADDFLATLAKLAKE